MNRERKPSPGSWCVRPSPAVNETAHVADSQRSSGPAIQKQALAHDSQRRRSRPPFLVCKLELGKPSTLVVPSARWPPRRIGGPTLVIGGRPRGDLIPRAFTCHRPQFLDLCVSPGSAFMHRQSSHGQATGKAGKTAETTSAKGPSLLGQSPRWRAADAGERPGTFLVHGPLSQPTPEAVPVLGRSDLAGAFLSWT